MIAGKQVPCDASKAWRCNTPCSPSASQRTASVTSTSTIISSNNNNNNNNNNSGHHHHHHHSQQQQPPAAAAGQQTLSLSGPYSTVLGANNDYASAAASGLLDNKPVVIAPSLF